MRFVVAAIALSFLTHAGLAQETKTPRQAQTPQEAPKIVLQSPDGKQSYDLAKLVEKGPVLIRLTCACTGCDAELAFFQKLQESYNDKGLQTIAVFREKPEAIESYAVKKQIRFMWLSDPKGDLWKTFDAKTMPTNILIEKGGKVAKVVSGCTLDGKNAQTLSEEVARLVQTAPVTIAEPKVKK
jgi:peroxiredoxin